MSRGCWLLHKSGSLTQRLASSMVDLPRRWIERIEERGRRFRGRQTVGRRIVIVCLDQGRRKALRLEISVSALASRERSRSTTGTAPRGCTKATCEIFGQGDGDVVRDGTHLWLPVSSPAEEEKHYWQYLSKTKVAKHLKMVLRGLGPALRQCWVLIRLAESLESRGLLGPRQATLSPLEGEWVRLWSHERLHARDGRRTGTGVAEMSGKVAASAEGYADSSLCAESFFGDQLGMM
ncbi:hypothetical protein HZ326_26379 [Fusarium oxysporum f. sp. albedinis]|nr:hypothetical protein HZ326_26379 [Fusarium oxysporum f. sp. albedinis]